MKNKIIICLYLLLCTFIYSKAQVKIGTNPNSINTNSLLELESTTKGFLPPRMALNSVNAVAPLTGTVPAGMLIYSTGGSVTDGYYIWNGTKWLSLSTSNNVRSNYVIVKSASDFPTAISGVRTLASNTIYEINGTVTLTDMIDLNKTVIKGGDATEDILLYTPTSGELFTGTNGGSVKNVTLAATGVGGKVFNINAGGANQNMIIENCFIANSNNIGTIRGFGGTVYLGTVAYQNNTNGITFQDNTNFVELNSLWDNTNHNTYEKFVGTFNVLQILGGDRLTLSANTATALDITGITSLSAATLKSAVFFGTGTFVNGSFSNMWEVETYGLNTEKDDVASGNLYISTPVVTIFSANNTPTKVLGTTTSAGLFRVTSSASNRLTYTGNKGRRFQVICSLTGTQTSSNIIYSFYIAKNGIVLPESKQTVKLVNSTDQQSITVSCTVTVVPNDYLELWVENNTNTTSLSMPSMNMAIK